MDKSIVCPIIEVCSLVRNGLIRFFPKLIHIWLQDRHIDDIQAKQSQDHEQDLIVIETRVFRFLLRTDKDICDTIPPIDLIEAAGHDR